MKSMGFMISHISQAFTFHSVASVFKLIMCPWRLSRKVWESQERAIPCELDWVVHPGYWSSNLLGPSGNWWKALGQAGERGLWGLLWRKAVSDCKGEGSHGQGGGKDLVVEKEKFAAEKSFILIPSGTGSGLRYTSGRTLPCFTDVPALLWLLQPCPGPKFCQRESQQHILAPSVSCAGAAVTSVLHTCSRLDMKSIPSQPLAEGCGHPEHREGWYNRIANVSTRELLPTRLAG